MAELLNSESPSKAQTDLMSQTCPNRMKATSRQRQPQSAAGAPGPISSVSERAGVTLLTLEQPHTITSEDALKPPR